MAEQRKITYRPATSTERCDRMAKKYNWPQPADVTVRYKTIEGDSIFSVQCGFEGDAEFPEGGIGVGVNNDD